MDKKLVTLDMRWMSERLHTNHEKKEGIYKFRGLRKASYNGGTSPNEKKPKSPQMKNRVCVKIIKPMYVPSIARCQNFNSFKSTCEDSSMRGDFAYRKCLHNRTPLIIKCRGTVRVISSVHCWYFRFVRWKSISFWSSLYVFGIFFAGR